MPDDLLIQFFALGLVLAVPIGCALALRATKVSGWPVLGGLLAGFLLGPTILGGMMPDRFETLFLGGTAEREALESIERRQGADVLAAQAAGGNLATLEDAAAVQRPDLIAAATALADARWRHQDFLRLFAAICVGLVLLGAASLRVRHGDRRQGFIAPLTIGIWAAAVPGGLVFAVAWRLWDFDLATSLLVGSAVAVGPWVLTKVDVEAADRAEIGGARLIQLAGRVSSVIALVTCAWALWHLLDRPQLLWSLPLLALPLGWLLPATGARLARPALEHVLLPCLAALVTIKVDFLADFHLWTILVIVLLDADGRWMGAVLGALALGGRRPLRTMRLALGSMACGPTMLAIAAVGAHTGALPPRFTLALALGAGLIEVTNPWRGVAWKRILQTELDLAEIEEHDPP